MFKNVGDVGCVVLEECLWLGRKVVGKDVSVDEGVVEGVFGIRD